MDLEKRHPAFVDYKEGDRVKLLNYTGKSAFPLVRFTESRVLGRVEIDDFHAEFYIPHEAHEGPLLDSGGMSPLGCTWLKDNICNIVVIERTRVSVVAFVNARIRAINYQDHGGYEGASGSGLWSTCQAAELSLN